MATSVNSDQSSSIGPIFNPLDAGIYRDIDSALIPATIGLNSARSITLYALLSITQLFLLPAVAMAKTCSFAYNFFSTHIDPKHKELNKRLVEYMHTRLQSSEDEIALLIDFIDQTMTKAERFIVLDILSIVKSPHLVKHIFQGANIKIQDQGTLYERWETLPGIKKRPSSHNHEKGEGKSLHHPLFKEFLFWKDKESGHTHFQLEKHSLRLSLNAIPHMILHFYDYICVKKDNLQMGPLGRSPFMEDSPITFNFAHESFLANRQKLKEKFFNLKEEHPVVS